MTIPSLPKHFAVAILAGLLWAPGARCEVRIGVLGAVKSAGKKLGKSASPGSTACTAAQLSRLERSMTSTLDSAVTDADFTLMLESADGRSYRHSEGASSGAASYRSASTSKLVTAVVILSLVDRGFLTLDSKPQDFISFWTPAPSDPAYGVTLRHLLSFTSGLHEEPPAVPPLLLGCMDRGASDFEDCVQQIYDENIDNAIPPGSQFFYSGSHMQVAGLMAVKAREAADVNFSSWSAVFNEFKTRTGLFPTSVYDLPSDSNPRLAGGMHWTGEEYLGFLRALYRGQVLSKPLREELWASQRGAAVVPPGGSPIVLGVSEDWPYALGNWVECPNGCGGIDKSSSPGAYGAYPFIDFKNRYFGILAREGALGTFVEGLTLFRQVEDDAARWGSRSCGD